MTLDHALTKRISEIGDAISEARRFIKAAESARLALSSKDEWIGHSKSFAAAKRSSMDLTRALAKMRGTAQ
jgi:hypothetical protein